MSTVLAVICGILVVAVDQLTKYLVTVNMELNQVITVIPGIINFNRIIPNAGAAFGILQGQTWLLITITGLIMVICLAMLIRKTFDSRLMFWALCLVLGGGVGNLIDRVLRDGNVVDFLEFAFFDFPVFNVADCAICIGAGLMVVYFIVDFIKDSRRKHMLDNVDFSKTDEEPSAVNQKDSVSISNDTPDNEDL